MLEVGKQCEECGYRDFLPFNCTQCKKVLCADHRLVDAHQCISINPGGGGSGNGAASAKPATSTSHTVNSLSSSLKSSRIGANTPHTTPQRLGGASNPSVNRPKPSMTEQSRAPNAKTDALDRLRALIGGRSSASSRSVAKPNAKINASIVDKTRATGDPKTPTNDRVYMALQRPKSTYTDALTGKLETRPAKSVSVYYSKTTRLGQVTDRASGVLGVSVHGLTLNGSVLEPSRLVSSIPANSVLEAVLTPPSPASSRSSAVGVLA